jgi:hypothetical protein
VVINDKLQSVLGKITKLRALAARATTQAEAEAAAAQAAALIAKYQIDEAQIETPDTARTEEVTAADHPFYLGRGRNKKWRSYLATGLAELHGCALVHASMLGMVRYRIAGRPSDVEIVRYLFAWLHVEIARLSERERGRAAKNAFRLGATLGVLRAMTQTRRGEMNATPKGATVALATIDRVQVSLDALMNGKKPRTASQPTVSDGDALRRGVAAGVNLTPKPAIATGDGTLLLIAGSRT